MLSATNNLLVISLSLGLAFALPAQEEPTQPPTVVTQAEQNELRATAYKAEKAGSYQAAADAFLKLSEAEPNNIKWVVAAGKCLGRSGRFREAIDLLDAGRKRFPGDIEISAMLARTLVLQTETVERMLHPEISLLDAAEIAEDILKINPDHADSRLLLAQARYSLGHHEEASRHANEAVKRHPKRAGAHILAGRIACDQFQRLLATYQAEEPTGQAASDQVAAIHKYRMQAIEAYKEAARIDPTRAFPHVALSQIATIDRKDGEAKQHLLDALAVNPDVSISHAMLTEGMSWQERSDLYGKLIGRFENANASTIATTGHSSQKKLATLQFHQGVALMDGGQFQAAQELFNKSIKNNPEAKNSYYYCFLAAYYLKDFDAAEDYAATYARAGAPAFADVVRSLETSSRVQVAAMVKFLGDHAFQSKRIPNSRDLNHVTACLMDSADAWNNHAFLCRETGDFANAYSSYQHAIEKEPGSPQLWNDAAVILQYHLPSKENLAKARSMYEKALVLAQKVLDDSSSSPQSREFAKQAQDHARLNIKTLDDKPAIKRPQSK